MAEDLSDMGTDQLSDHYGKWLEANGFKGHESADEVLMFAPLTDVQKTWVEDFIEVWKVAEEREDAALKPD